VDIAQAVAGDGRDLCLCASGNCQTRDSSTTEALKVIPLIPALAQALRHELQDELADERARRGRLEQKLRQLLTEEGIITGQSRAGTVIATI
jgi:hypothetical protein